MYEANKPEIISRNSYLVYAWLRFAVQLKLSGSPGALYIKFDQMICDNTASNLWPP